MTRAGRVARLALLAALGSGALAGCGSDGPATPASSTPVGTATTTPGGSASATPPVTSAPPSSSPAATTPTPTASGSSAPASSAPATGPVLAACSDLDVAVTRLPGGAGIGYGLVSVTNRGTSRCALPGVPTLRLLGADRSPLTAPASAAAGGDGPALVPGAVASTLLADRSDTCQADVRSAYVEVTATPAAATVVAALVLPPCTLSVKPFTPGGNPSP